MIFSEDMEISILHTDVIFEHEFHEFHELFRADDTSIHMQVTVATATENLWKSVQSVGV